MIHKKDSDWEKSKQRFAAYWQGEMTDRAVISVTAPITPDATYEWFDRSVMTREEKDRTWLDGELILKQGLHNMEATYYGGDSFPLMILDLGAAGVAGFFKGSRYQLEDTVWFFPSLKEGEDLEFDENAVLYRKTIELAKYFADESNGRYFVDTPDSSGWLDALAHLRGNEELLMDLIDNPEWVKRQMRKIGDAWHKTMDQIFDITTKVNDGGNVIGWLGTWGPGRHTQMQADISVMLSPDMYREFVVPELIEQTSVLDNALYHFDGEEQTRHLEALCELPQVKAIQWTNIAGRPSATHYLDTLKRMQKAGKRLHISVGGEKDLTTVLTELSSKGLMVCTWCDTPEEADYVVKLAEKLAHE